MYIAFHEQLLLFTKKKLYYATIMNTKWYITPIGMLEAEYSDEQELYSLRYLDESEKVRAGVPSHDAFSEELAAFFKRDLQAFSTPTVPLEAYSKATALQRDVWKALKRVSYNTTASYKKLAALSDHAEAIRAVASAVAKNPLPIVIPCHRIIHEDGSLGNYALHSLGDDGCLLKKQLIALEQGHSITKG